MFVDQVKIQVKAGSGRRRGRLRWFRLSGYRKAGGSGKWWTFILHRLPHQPPPRQVPQAKRQGHWLDSIYWKPQILRSKQSGAYLPHHQMPIWVSKSPIPGLEEKREPAVCHVCLRKPLPPGDGRAKTAGSMTGGFAPFLWDNLKKTGQKPALGRRNWLNSGRFLRPLPSCLLIWAFFRGSLKILWGKKLWWAKYCQSQIKRAVWVMERK